MKEVPAFKLENGTLVMEGNEQLFFLDTALVLPVGASIQLGNPNRDYRVIGVRLLGPTAVGGEATVCLDVKRL